jgi:hypothetical protein
MSSCIAITARQWLDLLSASRHEAEHFQKPDVLELLLPWTEGLGYGTKHQARCAC